MRLDLSELLMAALSAFLVTPLVGCSGDPLASPGDACQPGMCGSHGECLEGADGEAVCFCDRGYSGERCGECADGYQDNNQNGSCSPSCESASLSCVNGECDDSSGTARCVCDPTFDGESCEQCVAGYQDNDGDGRCSPECETLGYGCGYHGFCDDSSGEARCVCEPGFADSGTGDCLASGDGTSCDEPMLLPLIPSTVEGTTAGLMNEHEGACVEDTYGFERIYLIVVERSSVVTFETQGYDTVLYLRRECDDPATEIACDDDGGPLRGSRIRRRLDPGAYYLVVDSYSGHGDYSLSVRIECGAGRYYDTDSSVCTDDPCAPNPCEELHRTGCERLPSQSYVCHCDPGYEETGSECVWSSDATGEGCDDPVALEPTMSPIVDNTVGAPADHGGSCAGEGPERVYALTLAEAARVSFTTTGYDTVLYLRAVCDDPMTEVGCDDDSGPDHGSHLSELLPPGTYFLFADSYSGGGELELSFSVNTDPCVDEEAACPGDPVCLAAHDWASFRCICPEGTVAHGESCVQDPCAGIVCQAENRGRCVRQLPSSYSCECNAGYMEDPTDPSSCVVDPQAAEWAVLVYLNADNNLDSFAYGDLDEMKQIASADDIEVIVFLDTFSSEGGRSRLLRILPDGQTELDDWTEADMSDWRTLRDFGVWAIETFPARRHALILWDHGGGWKRSFAELPVKGFSTDDNGSPGTISISNGDYARALAAIRDAKGESLEIVGFDACLMGMWEVAVATSPFARFLVASSENIPGTGWVYDGFLVPLAATPTLDASALGALIVDSYHDGSSSNSTLSLTDLSAVDGLNGAIDALGAGLVTETSLYPHIETLRQDALSFGNTTRRDLRAFAESVAGDSAFPANVRTAAQAVVDQHSIAVVHNRTQTGYEGSHGLSIYFPGMGQDMDEAYRDEGATWSAVAWDELLSAFHH